MSHRRVLALTLLSLLSVSAHARASFSLTQLGDTSYPESRWPYFEEGELHTTPASLVTAAEHSCRELIPDCPNRPGVLSTRSWSIGIPSHALLQCLCARSTAGKSSNFFFAGTDFQGKILWRMDGSDPRLKHSIKLLGASREGLLLSNGQILAPETGQRKKALENDEKHPLPTQFRFAASGILHPELGIFTFASRFSDVPKPGLYRFDADGNNGQRWFAAGSRWLVMYHEVAETLALSLDGRWLFAGTIWSARGPSPAQLTIYDLKERRIAKRLDLEGESQYLTIDSIVTGTDGKLALRITDAPPRPYRILHLRWAPEPGTPGTP